MGLIPSRNATLHTLGADSALDLSLGTTLLGLVKQGGANLPASITFSIGAGSANISNITITVVDAAGNPVLGVHNLDVWLSDAASGAGLTGTTASGTVQAKSASGTVLTAYVAKKALRVQTLATGVFVLEITDTAKTGFYIGAQLGGRVAIVSSQLVAASYG